MNTAELLIRCLENEGVRYVFGLPGEENLHVLEALKQSSIQFITTRHRGAAFMADVYGRLTGKSGVPLHVGTRCHKPDDVLMPTSTALLW